MDPDRRLDQVGELRLGASASTRDYPAGVQAWYNNFVEVDPGNPQHVYVGLEEVYETEDGGATWKTIGPYWNFGFDCFDPSSPTAAARRPRTPTSTRSRSPAARC